MKVGGNVTRQAGFIVTIYDEDGLRLAATMQAATPTEAFAEARKIVDNKIEEPKKVRASLPLLRPYYIASVRTRSFKTEAVSVVMVQRFPFGQDCPKLGGTGLGATRLQV